jgi:hypothetical protein
MGDDVFYVRKKRGFKEKGKQRFYTTRETHRPMARSTQNTESLKVELSGFFTHG